MKIGGTHGDDHRRRCSGRRQGGGAPTGAIVGGAALIVLMLAAVVIVRRRRGAAGEARRARGGLVRRARSWPPCSLLALRAGGGVRARGAATTSTPERGARAGGGAGRSRSDSPSRSRRSSAPCASTTRAGAQVQAGETYHPGGREREVAVKLKDGLPRGRLHGHLPGDLGRLASDLERLRVLVGERRRGRRDRRGPAGRQRAPGRSPRPRLGVARGLQYARHRARARRASSSSSSRWMPGLREAAGGGPRWAAAAAALRRAGCGALLLVAAVAGALSAARASCSRARPPPAQSFWSALEPERDRRRARHALRPHLGPRLARLAAGRPARRHAGRKLPVLRPASVGATGLALPAASARSLILLGAPAGRARRLPVLGGHASVQTRARCCCRLNIVHVVAMAAWLGGIAVLVLALRAATAALEGGRPHAAAGRRRRALLGARRRRHRRDAAHRRRAVDRLHGARSASCSTRAFGRAVLIKIVLFLAIARSASSTATALLPQLRAAAASGDDARPRRPAPAAHAARRAGARRCVVLAVTGALASYAPSIAESSRPLLHGLGHRPGAHGGHGRSRHASARTRCTSTCSTARPARQYDETKELTVTRRARPEAHRRRSSSSRRRPAPATT